jgi:hypothetical protein
MKSVILDLASFSNSNLISFHYTGFDVLVILKQEIIKMFVAQYLVLSTFICFGTEHFQPKRGVG